MGIVQSGVIRPKTKNVQVLTTDHNRLKHLSLDLNMNLKTLVTKLIDDYKELQILKAS